TSAGGVGEWGARAVVLVATTVEHDRLDAGCPGALGQELADLGTLVLLVALECAHVGLERRRRGHRVACQVVDDLGVDVPRGALDDQPRTLRRPGDLLAEPVVAPGAAE